MNRFVRRFARRNAKRLATLLGSCLRAGAVMLLLTSVLFAQAPAVHGSASNEVSVITRAESAMDGQQWPEAEAILRKLVAANAKDAQAWFDLGYVMNAQHNYPEAILAYRGAVAAQPNSFECNLNLGTMLAHENLAEAFKYLELATRLKPTGENPQEALARAWATLAQEQDLHSPKSALDSWSHAVSLAPGNAMHRLGLGQELELTGDLPGAEREFRRTLELNPNSTDALAALSNFLMRARRLPEAEEVLRKLVAEAPQNENAHLQLGRVLSVSNKHEEASAELKKALVLRPDDWDALRELAFAQEQGKHFDQAEESYRALLPHFPNDAEIYNGLGSVLLLQLKYAEAQSKFLACVRLKPESGEAYGQLAMAAAGNKQYELAIKSLDERKKWLPELPSTFFLRATCYDHLRQFAEAVEYYKAFLAASKGQFPDDEWKARHRLVAIEPEANRKR